MVLCVLNSMVAASPEMMSELRNLRDLLDVYGIRIEARWIPSAVNLFTNHLSRTWNSTDVRATSEVISSLLQQHNMDEVVFRQLPLSEPVQARRRYLQQDIHNSWAHERARLWIPPFDILPFVIRNIAPEGAKGVLIEPFWSMRAWYELLRSWSSKMTVLRSKNHQTDLWEQDPGKTLNLRWDLL